jgi:hypothetical protein
MRGISSTYLTGMTNVSEVIKSLLQDSLVTFPTPMDEQEAIHLHNPT